MRIRLERLPLPETLLNINFRLLTVARFISPPVRTVTFGSLSSPEATLGKLPPVGLSPNIPLLPITVARSVLPVVQMAISGLRNPRGPVQLAKLQQMVQLLNILLQVVVIS